MSFAWISLVVAGLFEVAWALFLRSTHGFTRLVPSVLVIAAIAASIYLLAYAQRTIPIALAYAVWVGIGVLGTALASTFLLHEPLRPLHWLFIALILAGVAGLKFTS